jgi:Raf kinase inhibitor-like YbhB/YbcL family protein
MKLTSSAFVEGGKIPSKFTCQGEDINPELHFKDVPSQAKALVLILDDPDVPEHVRKDRMYDHWVVYNIPPTTTRISENSQPPGTPGKNTRGDLDYIGPCPPDREHRYFFKLYALDQMLQLKEGATKPEVEKAMEGHVIAQTQLMGRYQKHKE